MLNVESSVVPLSRRSLLAAASALVALSPLRLIAEPAAPQHFSFDALSEEMKALAAQPFVEPAPVTDVVADLDYDDYRLVRFRPDRQRWKGEGDWNLAAFPMGWLFKQPVILYEVKGNEAQEMRFSTEDFEYLNDLASRVPAMTDLSGVAGFRLHYPLNRPDVMDEVVAFIGASYFRALGQGSAYGLSARGLALNTASPAGEEFPSFTRFYLERTDAGITIYAALDSPSVTGAYRFVMHPGRETVMDVTARLHFRKDVEELGIAPLTSMFLFAEKSRTKFDDFRPNVHDSDGLRIERRSGEISWRPLNNPPRLSGSYFAEDTPKKFGLHQRNRDFANYQDAEAHYHRRPSVDVEPVGEWGRGFIRLVEIPSDLEANDNIVAYWVPEAKAKAGEAREFSYRLHWGDLPIEPGSELAFVQETRAGHGGYAGVEIREGSRKFVIDFKGGALERIGASAQIEPIVTVSNGTIESQVLQFIPEIGVWRLILDVAAEADAVVELSAHLAGYDRKLSENWLYQWINVA